jgi:hypothetical protein
VSVSEGGRGEKPGSSSQAAGAELRQQENPLVPRKTGLFGASRMDAVHAERREVAQSLDRRMAAMRKASGEAKEPAAIPKGGGSGLPDTVRARMEPKLGADLSGVRVHTAGESATAAGQLGARAFTVGSDVHFNSGEFAPGTKEGDKLLAHELTHVVQGQRSGVQRKAEPEREAAGGGEHAAAGGEGQVSHPDEPAEKEADGVSEKVADELHGGEKGGGKHGEKHHAKGHGDDQHDGGAAHDGGGHHPGEHSDDAAAGSDSKPKESPAPISAKFIGVGRKLWRAPKAATASAPAAARPPAVAANTEGGITNQQGMTPEKSLTTDHYATFKARFAALQTSVGMPVDEEAGKVIWLQVVRTLQATDPLYSAVPAAASNPNRKDLGSDAFQKIMAQFNPITAALQPYMEKWTKGKKSWAFWSGKGASDVARKNADVSLEKSALGSLLDGVNLNGNWDTQMWASLSRAYATAAAKNVEQKTYKGFVGLGSAAEASIFNKIEQPQFVSMLDQKQAANIKVTWHAVALEPKDQKFADPTCNVGGMEGVMGVGADRASMVALAESGNAKRIQLFQKTGKVVSFDQVDAALAAVPAAAAPAAGSAAVAPPVAGAPADKNKGNAAAVKAGARHELNAAVGGAAAGGGATAHAGQMSPPGRDKTRDSKKG